MLKIKIGIYKITSPSNRVYIGQSNNIERRFNEYKNKKGERQPKLNNSFIKYGVENHKFEIVEECLFEDLNTRERYWQDYYNVLNLGLNCTLTNSLTEPFVLSQEAREKRGKNIKKFFSEKSETIYQFDLNGTLIKTFKNRYYVFLNYPKIKSYQLAQSLVGKKLILHDFLWSFENKINENIVEKVKSKIKKLEEGIVFQYDLEGNFIKEWVNKKAIVKTLNIQVDNCLKNKVSNTCGFIWRYKKDNFIFSQDKKSRVCLKRKDHTNFKIYIYDKLGNLHNTVLSKDMVKDRAGILKCFTYYRKNYKNFVYSKKELTKEEVINCFYYENLKIYQYSLDGTFVKEWKSGREILKEIKMGTSSLFNENGILFKRNFIWSKNLLTLEKLNQFYKTIK